MEKTRKQEKREKIPPAETLDFRSGHTKGARYTYHGSLSEDPVGSSFVPRFFGIALDFGNTRERRKSAARCTCACERNARNEVSRVGRAVPRRDPFESVRVLGNKRPGGEDTAERRRGAARYTWITVRERERKRRKKRNGTERVRESTNSGRTA